MSKLFDSDDEGPTAPSTNTVKKVPTFRPKFQAPPMDDSPNSPMFANPIVGAGAPAAAQSQQSLPGSMPAMPVNIVQQYVDSTNAAAAAKAAGEYGKPTVTSVPPPAAVPPQQYYTSAPAPAVAPAAPTAMASSTTAAYKAANPTASPWDNMTESSANFLAAPNPWGGPLPSVAPQPTASAPAPAIPTLISAPTPQVAAAYPTAAAQPPTASAAYQPLLAPQQASPEAIALLQQQQQRAALEQQMAMLKQQMQQLEPSEPAPAVAAPPPPPPPTVSQAVWPADLPPLPPAPEQGVVQGLAPLPAAPGLPTFDPLKAHLSQTTNDTMAWESFLQLRKQLEDAHQHTINLHAQISQIQLAHEKEAAQFREAAQARIDQQRKELEQAVENYNTALSKIDNLSSILNKKAEAVLALEQRVHELTVENAAAAQRIAHVDDRARVADAGRQVAEVRQRELELTLDHTSELVVNLRKQMQGSHEEKAKALHEQYGIFEQYRQSLISYYTEREAKQLDAFNLNIKQVQALMDLHVKEREEKIAKHWKDTILTLEAEYREVKKTNEDLVRRHTAEMEEHKRNETLEKEKWISHLRSEMELLERRHKEREDHVLTDIARRERELSEREQRGRVTRAQDEQDAKIALMSREAELKAYYEKLAEDMRKAFDSEREKTAASFRDQIQQLQNQHLNNERELERMHREKEREMAQRYRIAGYEVEDTKTNLDLQNASAKTQSSLLSKFDSIEAKQRERAEQTRQAIKTTSLSGVGLTPGLGAATGTYTK